MHVLCLISPPRTVPESDDDVSQAGVLMRVSCCVVQAGVLLLAWEKGTVRLLDVSDGRVLDEIKEDRRYPIHHCILQFCTVLKVLLVVAFSGLMTWIVLTTSSLSNLTTIMVNLGLSQVHERRREGDRRMSRGLDRDRPSGERARVTQQFF